VAILMDDGTTDTWMVNAADGQVQVRIEQGGINPPAGWRQNPNWINDVLVPTAIMINGKARRWGPDAGHGSPFLLTRREIEA
jgi:hypothetical protein